MTDGSIPPLTLREEAAAWFAKMRGDDAAEYRAAFEQWLARGAMHRAAYNRVGEIFAAGKLLKPDAKLGQTTPPRHQRQWAAFGLASLATGLAIFYVTDSEFSRTPDTGMAQSQPAARRAIALAAGGLALLDVDGIIAPGAGRRAAAVRLLQGRARFSVAADGADHKVLAGATEIRSRGGTFDLWLQPGGSLDTQVLSGDVRLLPAAFTSDRSARSGIVRLLAGEHCRIDPRGRLSRSRAPYGTDWPQGILEFKQAALADVLEEANRYAATKIELADPTLGARRITGRFVITDARRLARRLALALSLDIDERRPGRIILRARKEI